MFGLGKAHHLLNASRHVHQDPLLQIAHITLCRGRLATFAFSPYLFSSCAHSATAPANCRLEIESLPSLAASLSSGMNVKATV